MLINLNDFELLAKEKLEAGTYDYYASGTEDEVTLRENRAAFDRIKLRPRWLTEVSSRDLSMVVLGQRWSMPVGIAPTALAGMAHPDGECGIARAAGQAGIGATISTFSTVALEDVAKVATAPLWFQLYVYRDRSVTRRLVERAENAGYQALVLTVDVPVTSKRERDRRSQFRVPPHIVLANFTEFALDQVPDTAGQSAIIAYAQALLDPSLTWEAISWLRSITQLPVLVKGILRGDDAALAVAHGAAGIIVSNHGGRQLDSSPASIEVLPEIVDAVGGQCEILLDGGIRRGTDIIKALALGAKAVLIGRPTLWGLAVNGEGGVGQVLEILRAEFDTSMALCGCRTVSEISHDLIFTPR